MHLVIYHSIERDGSERMVGGCGVELDSPTRVKDPERYGFTFARSLATCGECGAAVTMPAQAERRGGE